MHPVIFQGFERLLLEADPDAALRRGRVLEIGAMPEDDTLLNLPCLAGSRLRLGVNLAPASRRPGFAILQADANNLGFLADEAFEIVLSNSTLEHDRRFWLTLAEMRRLLRPGGLLLVGVPGFGRVESWQRAKHWLNRFAFLRRRSGAWRAAELTLARHDMPADYWRFSEAAARDVFLEGLEPLGVSRLLDPPRFLALGRKPA
jgi:SAM-dependent methyltransferase